MRAVVKKKPAAKAAAIDARKELVKLRKWVREALTEVKLAREYIAKQYMGPEHEALDWAQQLLENALRGKAAVKQS